MESYAQGRLRRLEGLKDGEEGVLDEVFPRLQHRSETMSVAEFLDANSEVSAHDPTADAVTLYGMRLPLRPFLDTWLI